MVIMAVYRFCAKTGSNAASVCAVQAGTVASPEQRRAEKQGAPMTTFEVHHSTVAVALADYQRRHGTPPPSALATGAAVTELQAAGIAATQATGGVMPGEVWLEIAAVN